MTDPQFALTGKVAILTGASKGIGEAIARRYARSGARVVVSSRKLEAVESVAASIREAGGEALAVAAHTGNASDVEALVRRATEAFGGISGTDRHSRRNYRHRALSGLSRVELHDGGDVRRRWGFLARW